MKEICHTVAVKSIELSIFFKQRPKTFKTSFLIQALLQYCLALKL